MTSSGTLETQVTYFRDGRPVVVTVRHGGEAVDIKGNTS